MSPALTPSVADPARSGEPTLTAAPTIDVIVPAYNEERHIERCLAAVLGQEYPRHRLAVYVIDAGSTDSTFAIAQAHATADPRVHVISGLGRLSTPEGLNVGIAAGTGELVARIDAHWYPDPDYLARAVEAFHALPSSTACVGGPPKQVGESAFGWALGAARTSRFGVGGSPCYSLGPRREEVYTLQGGVYRRTALEEIGTFDPAMVYGEDEELNWRIRSSGRKIFLDSALGVHYVTRSTWMAACRQYRNYGDARIRVVAAHPGFLRLHHLAPAVMVAGAGVLMLGSLRSTGARKTLVAAGGLYGTTAIVAASAVDRGDRASMADVVRAFTALHLGYGVGELQGLLRLALRSPWGKRRTVGVSSEVAG